MSTPLDVALGFIERGWAPLPIPFMSKKPVIENWPNLRISREQAPTYFNGKPQNIGIILGAASAGLTDIDLDCSEAVGVSGCFLPPTKAIFGRVSRRFSHYLYVSDLSAHHTEKAIEFKDPARKPNESNMIVELRIGGAGAQTIMPGSVHESGEPINWDVHGAPAEVEGADLKMQVAKLAAAALLARYWPTGGRHDAALTLGGLLARAGWSVPQIKLFTGAVARAAGDPEIRDRERAAEDAAETFEKGGKAYGLPNLESLFGKPIAEKVCEWIGYVPGATGSSTDGLGIFRTKDGTDPVQAIVERFNSKFMLVNETGKATILQPTFDPVLKRRRYDRLAVKDLQTLYMNESVEVGKDDKGRPVIKPVADVWLRHPARRQYIDGITFDPTAAQQDGVLNLWTGFAVEAKAGDWSLMRAHIQNVICDADPIRFDYLMGWMARMLQNPAEQGEVAVVMRGGEGTGKGSLAKALMKITGHHGLAIANAKHLVGNFNAHLRDVIFLFADEAFFAGDRSHIGALKSLITEPHLPLEGKFQNVVLAPNFLHLMMASNEEWVVPASLDARRFFVLEVPDTMKGNHPYFGKIWAQMDAGGYGAMLHDLLARDLTTFNVRSVPATEGLQYQRKLSLPTTEAWWLDCLERGYVFKSKVGLHDEFGRWHETVTTELLFASYMDFVKQRGERRPLTREHLGRFFTDLRAIPSRPRNGIVGEQIINVKTDFGSTTRQAATIKQARSPAYGLGSLEAARDDFSKKLKIDLPWDSAHPLAEEDDP